MAIKCPWYRHTLAGLRLLFVSSVSSGFLATGYGKKATSVSADDAAVNISEWPAAGVPDVDTPDAVGQPLSL